MKITSNWLKDHLDTKFSENQIIDKLTDIGLEVESIEAQSSELDSFIIAKILKTEKHPGADRLKVCDVDIGKKDSVKVVCGAPNAKEGLLTIYAPPSAVIPKNQMKLVVSKIRGVSSYGMLCSKSELNLSDESNGITELSNIKYKNKIGKNYFPKSTLKVIDISITPNRADCLGVKGLARDLASAGLGKLKDKKKEKLIQKNKQKINIKITKEKIQGCNIFGTCLIVGVKNIESPEWLKKKLYH
jgi:phenylalanyl-tRNA synthetase beta chain